MGNFGSFSNYDEISRKSNEKQSHWSWSIGVEMIQTLFQFKFPNSGVPDSGVPDPEKKSRECQGQYLITDASVSSNMVVNAGAMAAKLFTRTRRTIIVSLQAMGSF